MGSPVPAIPEVKQQWPCAEESGAEGGMAVQKWCASISPIPTWKSSEQELVHAAVASCFCSGLLLSIPCSVHSLLRYMHMTDLFPCHAFICTTIHYSLPTQGCLGNSSETSPTSQAAQPAQAVQAQPAQLLKTRPGRILLYSFLFQYQSIQKAVAHKAATEGIYCAFGLSSWQFVSTCFEQAQTGDVLEGKSGKRGRLGFEPSSIAGGRCFRLRDLW